MRIKKIIAGLSILSVVTFSCEKDEIPVEKCECSIKVYSTAYNPYPYTYSTTVDTDIEDCSRDGDVVTVESGREGTIRCINYVNPFEEENNN